MAIAADHEAYANPAWGGAARNQGWGQAPGQSPLGVPFWQHPALSRPAWIAAMILGFMFWWPVGLALLFYLIGSGRMGCRSYRRQGAGWESTGWTWPWSGWENWCSTSNASRQTASSGNRAFDEYRAETLRRLEEEQKEFGAFLDRLRFAKDKAEFDQFMAERRQRPPSPDTSGQQPAQG